jgi:hypothetical protein
MTQQVYQSIFLAASWGLVLIVSFVGLGRLLNRILIPAFPAGWGQQAVFGMALSVIIGGWLNLLGIISPPVVLAIVLAGLMEIASALYRQRTRIINVFQDKLQRYRENQYVPILVLCVVLLAFLKYWGAAAGAHFSFNDMDDFTAYFAFPEKMLQTGGLGTDPFSERRLFGLGGQSFLQTFVLVLSPVGRLQVIDPGIPLLILLGIVSHACRLQRISVGKELFLLLFIVLSISPISNTSTGLMGTVFFASLCLIPHDAQPLRRGFLIGLLAAALCSLKSILMPFCALAILVDGFCPASCVQPRRTRIACVLVTGAWTLAFMVPWMVSMWQSSHTPLYPFLGAGYHGSNQPASLAAASNTAWIAQRFATLPRLVICYPLLAMAPAMVLWRRSQPMLSGLWLATTLIVILFIAILQGPAIDVCRYTFAPLSAVTVLWMLSCMRTDQASDAQPPWIQRTSSSAMLAILTAIFLLGSSWYEVCHSVRSCMWAFQRLFAATDITDALELAQCTRAQSSLTPGATLLARTDRPYLFDFKRNHILLIDTPGGAGPPPGVPMFQGPDALAEYLLANSVRYVVYSYGNESGFRKSKYEPDLAKDLPQWTRLYIRQNLDFQNNLSILGATRHLLFDDGSMFIIDLATKTTPKHLSSP